jgi:outer membrane protein assembly factor BamB
MRKRKITLVFLILFSLSSLSMRASMEEPQLIWKFKANDEIKSSPAIYGNTIYVSSMDNHTYAIDSNSGELKWKFDTKNPIESSPVVVEGAIYIYSSSKIYCLDPERGTRKWEFTSTGKITAVKAHKNGVYIGTEYGYIYSLNTTGECMWRIDGDGKVLPMEIANNILYTPAGMNLYAIDGENGAIIWKYQTTGIICDKPLISNISNISNKTLYVVAGRGNLYALNAANGILLWSFRAGDTIAAAPEINGDTIYFGSNDHYVYALNASDGSLLWKTKLRDYAVLAFIKDGIIYVRSGWYIWTLNEKNGTSIWNYHATSQVIHPTIFNDILYVGEASGNLTALDAKTGEVKWQFKASNMISNAPIISKGYIYINSADGYTYALKTAITPAITPQPTPSQTSTPGFSPTPTIKATQTPTHTPTPSNITIISHTPVIIKEKSSQGFEFLLAVIAIFTLLYLRKKIRN